MDEFDEPGSPGAATADLARRSAVRGWWGAWSALVDRFFSGGDARTTAVRPVVRRGWFTTELRFARGVSQSRMLNREPDRLLIDYTRTMLGALLLVPQPRDIGMIGLGGGSLAKFCHRHLPGARLEVVENDPQVLALRRRFRIPDDDARFRVLLADGARLMRERRGAYDLLLADGYDAYGIAPALSTQAFYDDCRDALRERGVLAVNLFCRESEAHVERLQRSFGADRVRVVGERRQSNRVAFAWKGTPDPGEPSSLAPEGQRELAFDFARLRAMGLGELRPRHASSDHEATCVDASG